MMDRICFEEFRDRVFSRESEIWQEHLQIRWQVENSFDHLAASVGISTKKEAVLKGFETVSRVLNTLKNLIDLSLVDPGHGVGHLSRDLINANLMTEEEIAPADLYVGIIAAALHDILGCSLVDRYADKRRALKHAEVSAVLWREIARELDLDEATTLLVYYSIAGHTHLLKALTVRCEDGTDRVCEPYADINPDGSPRLMCWFTRMCDRLDLVGPCFLGRHYLTLHKDHMDYDGSYFPVTFAAHMRPLLRSDEEIRSDPNGRTLREHLALFANSQTNQSVYGRFDGKVMQQIRNASRQRSLRIIDSFEKPANLHSVQREYLLDRWTGWLSEKVEPSLSGKQAAENLKKRFISLADDVGSGWNNVMNNTLDEYRFWRIDQLQRLSGLALPHLIFPIIGDIREIL